MRKQARRASAGLFRAGMLLQVGAERSEAQRGDPSPGRGLFHGNA
jgi:hypothetical protein